MRSRTELRDVSSQTCHASSSHADITRKTLKNPEGVTRRQWRSTYAKHLERSDQMELVGYQGKLQYLTRACPGCRRMYPQARRIGRSMETESRWKYPLDVVFYFIFTLLFLDFSIPISIIIFIRFRVFGRLLRVSG